MVWETKLQETATKLGSLCLHALDVVHRHYKLFVLLIVLQPTPLHSTVLSSINAEECKGDHTLATPIHHTQCYSSTSNHAVCGGITSASLLHQEDSIMKDLDRTQRHRFNSPFLWLVADI